MRRQKSVAATKSAALSKSDKCQATTLKFDCIYRQPLNFMLPGDKYQYKTFWGSIFSICTILIISLFAGLKFIQLVQQSEYKIQVRTIENYFNHTDEFGYDDEFYVAGGVTAYDGSSKDISDLTIGQVKMYSKQWSSKTQSIIFTELPTKKCVNETEDNEISDFYQASPISK